MCDQVTSGRRFDPDLCPLLNTLPADERERRLAEDPVISACVAAVEGAGAMTAAAAKKRAAYDSICGDALTA
jgi:hypothetical protein